MHTQLKGHGASLDAIRELMVALHGVGLTGQLQVGCDGPEKFTYETPHLTPNQFASVVSHLVKFEGGTIADAIETLKEIR